MLKKLDLVADDAKADDFFGQLKEAVPDNTIIEYKISTLISSLYYIIFFIYVTPLTLCHNKTYTVTRANSNIHKLIRPFRTAR